MSKLRRKREKSGPALLRIRMPDGSIYIPTRGEPRPAATYRGARRNALRAMHAFSRRRRA